MRLTDVLLGSNWNATSGWAATAGRSYDVALARYGHGRWSVACNLTRIDDGTIGWIIRADGTWGHVAGVLAVSGLPEPTREAGGIVQYVPGLLFPLPRDWWLDGARLQLDGWQTAAPFGLSAAGNRMAQFQGGQTLGDHHVALIEQHLHPVALDWIEAHRG